MDLLSDLTIEPKLAPLKYRISASLIDFLILWLISFSMGFFFGEDYTDNDSYGFHVNGLPALVLFLINLSLVPIQEGLTGKTIGKRIVSIKVLREDFSQISVSRSIIRHLFDAVDMIFLVGLLVASVTLKKQRIGDLIAKTVVVID
jgi:uncharacterized RDD family membrane protein YckC